MVHMRSMITKLMTTTSSITYEMSTEYSEEELRDIENPDEIPNNQYVRLQAIAGIEDSFHWIRWIPSARFARPGAESSAESRGSYASFLHHPLIPKRKRKIKLHDNETQATHQNLPLP